MLPLGMGEKVKNPLFLQQPGHEIEMGHTVWDRLPYWGDDAYLGLNYAELKKSKYPVVVTTWGESYHYLPK